MSFAFRSTRARVAMISVIAMIAPPVYAAVPITSLLPATTPAWRVALPEPTAAERAMLKARNAAADISGKQATNLKGPLALAFPRDLPAGSATIALGQLSWQALADGTRAAR